MALSNSKESYWGNFKLQKKSQPKDPSQQLSSHRHLACLLKGFLIFHLLIYRLSSYLCIQYFIIYQLVPHLLNEKQYINLQITMPMINKRNLSSSKSHKQHTEQSQTGKQPLRLLNLS